MKQFVHLHLHTEYSLLDGSCRHAELLSTAAAMKMPAMGITDHGVMYGAVEFFKTAVKHGVKPIIGVEAYMASKGRTDKNPAEKYHHLILLAQNDEGYRNLMRLVSKANLEGFYYKPRMDKEILAAHSNGLICLSGCLSGEVNKSLLDGREGRARQAIGEFRDIFGPDRFFLEIQDHGLQEERRINPTIVSLSKELGVPLVATNDVHYLKKSDADGHDVLLCVGMGKTLGDPGRMRFETPEFYLKTPEEMWELFKEIPESLSNTLKVAEMCHHKIDLDTVYLPDFPVPPGRTEASYLEELCREGLARRYSSVTPEISQRLQYELSVINGKGLAAYFLIVWDFIYYAKSQGIPVGPGRGSAAGSLVAYLLGITDLDPLEHKLIFERFLNPERKSLPDIDTDFCVTRRDEVLRYVKQRYGSDRVCQIITFGRMKARAAVRDVGRVMNLPLPYVDKIAKLIPSTMTLKDALVTPEVAALCKQDGQAKRLLDTARMVEGLARNASIHAAGVIIAKESLTNYVPIQRMNGDEIVAQYEMNAVADIGLLKMDFLGLRNLTVIADAVRMIQANHGVTLDLLRLPMDDAASYKMLQEGRTNGVFQLESDGMRRYLRALKPDRFGDIVAMLALYRPGPLEGGMVEDYIQRRHGRQKVKYLHPSLEPVLKDTYGVILYQEQVMQIANALAGYRMAEADELRKAMGKKKPEEMAKHRSKFLAGCKAREIPDKIAAKIFDLMETFGGYGFNLSHSAAYALVAFQTAYLKAHYPREYMAALLTSVSGNVDKVSFFIQECKDLGIQVLAPHVNESAMNFSVVGEAIRFGLGAIKNAGEGPIAAILAARTAAGSFTDLLDLTSRVDTRLVNRRALEALVKGGALDGLGPNRATLLAALDTALDHGGRLQRDKASGQGSFFDMVEEESAMPSWPVQPELEKRTLLALEKEMLGLYISAHPLDDCLTQMERVTNAKIDQLMDIGTGQIATIAGLLKSVKRIVTKNNQSMAFAQLEDKTGVVEVVVLPKVFEQAGPLLVEDGIVVVRGKVEIKERFGVKEPDEEEAADAVREEAKLLADGVWTLTTAPPPQALRISPSRKIAQGPHKTEPAAPRAIQGVSAAEIEGELDEILHPEPGDPPLPATPDLVEIPAPPAWQEELEMEAVRRAGPGGGKRQTSDPAGVHIRVDTTQGENLRLLKEIVVRHPGRKPVILHLESPSKSTTLVLDQRHWVQPSQELNLDLENLLGGGKIWTDP